MYIIAVHSLIRVESRSSACVNNHELADIRYNHYVIVIMLRRCQSLKHRTLHKMVRLDLELCLKFNLSKVFQFLQIVFDVQWSIQNYFVVCGCYRKVLSIIAFCKHTYLRNSTFQGILGFSFYL